MSVERETKVWEVVLEFHFDCPFDNVNRVFGALLFC